ncbi:hypothetical protein WHR41_08047 [Cladosporium halotolerans]|uniref:Uncharacterized protein n=1 Tax=Cladosporium halotolerans TaxID=1052096 RepID=A0AB34KI97_9PEZI
MNGQQPGPLLDLDPTESCGTIGTNCSTQSSRRPFRDLTQDRFRRGENEEVAFITNETLALGTSPNRGPLLTTALALFGAGSFIEERRTRPEAYLYPNLTWEEYKAQPNPYACVGKAPFIDLLTTDRDIGPSGGVLHGGCMTRDVHNHDQLQRQIIAFVKLFYRDIYGGYEGERITNAFTSAAFLANEAWLTSVSREGSWRVSYDYGADAVVPVISSTGVILISVLMVLFLAVLLGLATYTAVYPRWTDQLDSFAMLRIGASISSDDIQFRPTDQIGKIKVLDRLPGWIGDGTEREGRNGQLALGGRGRLRGRMFEVYDVNPVT